MSQLANAINCSGSGYVVADGVGGFTTKPSGIIFFTDVSATPQVMAVNNGYTSNDGSNLVTFTLPVTAAYGSIFVVQGKASGLWTITYNSGQIIHFGAVNTTTTSGSLSSTGQYDNVTLLCTVANTEFTVLQSFGNLTYV
jgi:hypothetical protein